MLEEIKGDTFEEYLKTLTEEVYDQLALSGYNKSNMSPALIRFNEVTTLRMAKHLWQIKIKLDEMEDSRKSFIAEYRGE